MQRLFALFSVVFALALSFGSAQASNVVPDLTSNCTVGGTAATCVGNTSLTYSITGATSNDYAAVNANLDGSSAPEFIVSGSNIASPEALVFYNSALYKWDLGLGGVPQQVSSTLANGWHELSWFTNGNFGLDGTILGNLGASFGSITAVTLASYSGISAFTNVSAVPLPSAVYLFASALIGLGLLATRRRKDDSGAGMLMAA